METKSLLPHGACWFWNETLIALHTIPDMITFLCYMIIPIFLYYIYRIGHLRNLAIAFPLLWRLAAAFVFFCGISHLGAVVEVWYGGPIYYYSGINKIFMAVASVCFAGALIKHRASIATIGRIVGRVHEEISIAVNEDKTLKGL